MAGKKENIKSLFTNTRTRVIIIFTLVLVLLTIVIGYFKLRSSSSNLESTATLTYVPGSIQSIPGTLEPTAQYAHLQEEQNVNQAQQAEQTGGSAIPTIIRTQSIGQGVGVIGSQGGKAGVGFSTLAREDQDGTQKSLWLQKLKDASCSRSAVAEVIAAGAQLSDLKGACSCAQLKDDGYSLQDLNQVCSCKEIKAAGYNARQLKDLGYTAARLKDCGYNACELRNAGFSAQEMKDAGFSDGELKGAGFSDNEISKASGLPEGILTADVLKAGCSVDALAKLRQSGISASAIRRISGCSVDQLKAAGYTAKDLKDAGFSAADLKRAGFKPEELKAAGFSARDLLNAGFTPEELTKAGYTPTEIREAEAELPPGITPEDVKKAGCDVDVLKQERLAGVSAKLIRQYAGCSAQALKAAGYTDSDLANAGFTPEGINAAIPLTDAEAKAAGCNPEQLKRLLVSGVSAQRVKELNGCSAETLKNAGYVAKSLLGAGFTPEPLLAAGYSPEDLVNAESNPSELIAKGRSADCNVDLLKKAKAEGLSALTIKKTLGCSAQALKDAGFTAKDLKDAGFTAAELKNAGFSPKELKDAGFSAKDLKDAGFTAAQLKAAGFGAKALKDAGFSAKDLKDAGFTPEQLKAAGFDAKALKDAGFSAKDLKDAGFTAPELKAAGFSSVELLQAGFKPEESQMAGLGAPNMQNAPSSLSAIPAQPTLVESGKVTSNQQLQAIIKRQNEQLTEQKYEQKIQQKSSDMLSAANQMLADWKNVATQVHTEGDEENENSQVVGVNQTVINSSGGPTIVGVGTQTSMIKTGDILFAVIDTSINSDEPGPILATIVSGKLKGTKMIGSFNLPANSGKMVISFNTMSIPGAPRSISVSAYAIDPNTARTALSSKTNRHYLLRYGSLFASSFMEGIGNAFQSANTTVTIGGSGGGNNITVANGVGRSTLENAVIGLATLGKAWGQQAQILFNRPTTVEVYAGMPVGILFTQDVNAL